MFVAKKIIMCKFHEFFMSVFPPQIEIQGFGHSQFTAISNREPGSVLIHNHITMMKKIVCRL